MILVGTINTFLPGANMWVLSMPEVFDTPLFYPTGAIFVAISAFNLAMLLRLPTKEASEEIPRLSGESVPPDKWGAGSMSQPPQQVLLYDEPDQRLAKPHAHGNTGETRPNDSETYAADLSARRGMEAIHPRCDKPPTTPPIKASPSPIVVGSDASNSETRNPGTTTTPSTSIIFERDTSDTRLYASGDPASP